MSFKIDICDLLPLTLEEVKARLDDPVNRKKLGELKFLDLLVDDIALDGKKKETPRGMRHGVYFFFNERGHCAYIGRTKKQHFAERLGAHFGMQNASTGNEYIRRTIARQQCKWDDFSAYVNMAKEIGNHSIVLVAVHGWERTQEKYIDAGGSNEQFTAENEWRKEEFVNALEIFFQALYCPKNEDGEAAKDFLIKPQRGRSALRKYQASFDAKVQLAKLIRK